LPEKEAIEEQLQQCKKALENSNKELDYFVYIVSHDLKEPLRGLKTFSHFLLEDYEDKLDVDGKDKLRSISAMAGRLEAMLEALLHYSRIGSNEISVEEIDLNELMRGVVNGLLGRLKGRNTTIDIQGRLPVIRADRASIREVFHNLIDNAIKYSDMPENKIEIGVMTDHPSKPGETVFYVRDHGIGMQERHLKTIFTIFKRLHAKNAYGGGTGAGLAIVRKIIAQGGGEVWAESKGEGQGTCFYFTLPQRPPNGP
jgi:chemotaxis family two-component system sensor kinase Cph1